MIVAAAAAPSAHRRDEYLQAARLAIAPDAVRVQLDLTPGIALADAIVADIDRNRDGSFSPMEQTTYVSAVLSELELDVDGTRLQLQARTPTFPDLDAVRRGEGTVEVRSTATLPPLQPGLHQLSFRNRHHPQRSVYLANALVPESSRIAVMAQRRDSAQAELTIDYMLRAAPGRSRLAVRWALGAIAAALALSAIMRFTR